MKKHLPVFRTCMESFSFVTKNAKDWVKLSVGPVLFAIITMLPFMLMAGRAFMMGDPEAMAAQMTGFLPMALGLLALVGYLMALLMWSVNAYRYAAHAEMPPCWFSFRFDRYMGRMALMYVVLALILGAAVLMAMLVMIPASMIGHPAAMVVGSIIVGVGFIFLLMRLLFVIPLSAFASGHIIKKSWNASRGNVLRLLGMMLVLMLMALVAMIAFFVVAAILGAIMELVGLESAVALLAFVLYSIFTLFIYAVFMTAPVRAYRSLVEDCCKGPCDSGPCDKEPCDKEPCTKECTESCPCGHCEKCCKDKECKDKECKDGDCK